jgi:hypothetical protein
VALILQDNRHGSAGTRAEPQVNEPCCRRQDEQDARVVRVYLTEKGDRLFLEAASYLRQ